MIDLWEENEEENENDKKKQAVEQTGDNTAAEWELGQIPQNHKSSVKSIVAELNMI